MKQRVCFWTGVFVVYLLILPILFFSLRFRPFQNLEAAENEAVMAKATATVEDRDSLNDIKYQRSFFTLYSGYPVESPALFVAKDEKGFYRVQKFLSPRLGGGTEKRVLSIADLYSKTKPNFDKEIVFFIFAGKNFILSHQTLMNVDNIRRVKDFVNGDYIEVTAHIDYHRPRTSANDISPLLVIKVDKKNSRVIYWGVYEFKLVFNVNYSFEKIGIIISRPKEEIEVEFQADVSEERIRAINLAFNTTMIASEDTWWLLKINDGTPPEIIVQKYLALSEVETARLREVHLEP